MRNFYKWTPSFTRRLLNIYGPFIGAGVKVNFISEDWKSIEVSMKLRWYNRNAVGVHFGGSLYSMCDPHLMLMLMRVLGKNYIIWDKAAEINFISPGKGKVTCKIDLKESDIKEIKSQTNQDKPYLHNFELEVIDEANKIVAKVNKTLYVRKKRLKQKLNP